jgi:TatD DNase family protein
MINTIDIGLNLTSNRFKNKEKILEDAKLAGIVAVILTGSCPSGSEKSIELVNKMDDKYGIKIYSTVGIHPHEATLCTPSAMIRLENMASNEKVVAIGETGLDFNRNFSPQYRQIESFQRHIELAIKLNKPMFLHERDAHEKFMEVLEPYKDKIKCVVHCFTGDKNELKAYIDAGFYIGITGWLCDEKRNENLITAIKTNKDELLNKLMIETDAPYLNPLDPKVLNEPKLLPHILTKLSEVLEIDKKELGKIILENTQKFFSICL